MSRMEEVGTGLSLSLRTRQRQVQKKSSDLRWCYQAVLDRFRGPYGLPDTRAGRNFVSSDLFGLFSI